MCVLFLCYRHHKETNDVAQYPVYRLKQIKYAHEDKFKEITYNYSDAALDELLKESNLYWNHIEELHAKPVIPELAVPIDTKYDIIELINEVNDNLSFLNEISTVLMSEFKTTHFEYVCLALPNFLTRISVTVAQIEIKYIEELILRKPDAVDLKAKLKSLRDNFEQTAQSAGLAD